MSKISLSNIGDLTQSSTAQTTINGNFSTIQTAVDNTLSRDGTSPNQMNSSIDMNSNHILNLPSPNSANEPVRFQDLSTLQAGGTVVTLPSGGTTGQVLQKHSNTNYDVQWGAGAVNSVGLSLPADFTVSGSPITTSGTLTAVYATPPTGTGAFVKAASPTLTGTVTINGSVVDTSGNTSTPSLKITGTAGAGFTEYPAESSAPAAPVSGYRDYADSSGRKSWIRASDGFTRTIDSTLTANRVYTLPDATTTLVGTDATQSLTNKTITLTSPLAVSSGGTGASSASGTALDNISGFGATGLIARTGAGAYSARTITGTTNQITVTNGDGVSGNPTLSLSTQAPQVTIQTSGSGTYTTPTGAKYLLVELVGGGGGGAGSGSASVGTGGAGGNTTFGTSLLTGNGGAGGLTNGATSAGGTATGGDINIAGMGGGCAVTTVGASAIGGSSYYGGAGCSVTGGQTGITASTNSGSGGGGAGFSTLGGGGGAAGGYVSKLITSPSATYSYAVGAAGTAGTAGTSGAAGGAGGAGLISITAYFQ